LQTPFGKGYFGRGLVFKINGGINSLKDGLVLGLLEGFLEGFIMG
jgi:hypothetical protein